MYIRWWLICGCEAIGCAEIMNLIFQNVVCRFSTHNTLPSLLHDYGPALLYLRTNLCLSPTCTAGEDFSISPTGFNITGSNSRVCANISVIDDDISEGLEMFTLTLTSENAAVVINQGTASIELLDSTGAIPGRMCVCSCCCFFVGSIQISVSEPVK